MGRDETLLQVRRAEEEAEQIIKEAQESQKAIIAAARRQAIKATQEGEERLRTEFDQTLSREKAKIASQREEILARGKDEGLRVRTQATTRADKVRDDLKDNFVRALDATPRTNG
jgi:V/A-type H+-transporting ATPase subunit G/H